MKSELHEVGAIMAASGVAMGTIGGYAVSLPAPQAQLAGATAVAVGIMVGVSGDLLRAVDPPDDQYGIVVEPVIEACAFTDANRFKRPVRIAFFALCDTEMAIQGIMDAANTTVNRANTAWSKGDKASEQMQVDALNGFLTTLADLLAQDVKDRKRFANVYRSAGYKPVWNQEHTRAFPNILVNPKTITAYKALAAHLKGGR